MTMPGNIDSSTDCMAFSSFKYAMHARMLRPFLALTSAELAIERVGSLAEHAHESLRSLEPILRSGPAEERVAAIRRCVERAVVEFDAKRVKVFVRALPMDAEGPLAMGVEEVEAGLDAR